MRASRTLAAVDDLAEPVGEDVGGQAHLEPVVGGACPRRARPARRRGRGRRGRAPRRRGRRAARAARPCSRRPRSRRLMSAWRARAAASRASWWAGAAPRGRARRRPAALSSASSAEQVADPAASRSWSVDLLLERGDLGLGQPGGRGARRRSRSRPCAASGVGRLLGAGRRGAGSGEVGGCGRRTAARAPRPAGGAAVQRVEVGAVGDDRCGLGAQALDPRAEDGGLGVQPGGGRRRARRARGSGACCSASSASTRGVRASSVAASLRARSRCASGASPPRPGGARRSHRTRPARWPAGSRVRAPAGRGPPRRPRGRRPRGAPRARRPRRVRPATGTAGEGWSAEPHTGQRRADGQLAGDLGGHPVEALLADLDQGLRASSRVCVASLSACSAIASWAVQGLRRPGGPGAGARAPRGRRSRSSASVPGLAGRERARLASASRISGISLGAGPRPGRSSVVVSSRRAGESAELVLEVGALTSQGADAGDVGEGAGGRALVLGDLLVVQRCRRPAASASAARAARPCWSSSRTSWRA